MLGILAVCVALSTPRLSSYETAARRIGSQMDGLSDAALQPALAAQKASSRRDPHMRWHKRKTLTARTDTDANHRLKPRRPSAPLTLNQKLDDEADMALRPATVQQSAPQVAPESTEILPGQSGPERAAQWLIRTFERYEHNSP